MFGLREVGSSVDFDEAAPVGNVDHLSPQTASTLLPSGSSRNPP
jgi:hypothetical protein